MKKTNMINTSVSGLKVYVAPALRGVLFEPESLMIKASANVGDGFEGNDDISGGNNVGDGFEGEDLGEGGGANPGGGFFGEDIFYRP